MANPVARPSGGHLWHLALSVFDVPKMERFYVDVLGFAVEWKPDPGSVYLTTGADNLALHAGRKEGSASALGHLGLVVATIDAVDEWAAYLASHNVVLAAQPKTHRDGARSLYLYDPEKNLIQILYHPPISPQAHKLASRA